jgi:hypothetical protein
MGGQAMLCCQPVHGFGCLLDAAIGDKHSINLVLNQFAGATAVRCDKR